MLIIIQIKQKSSIYLFILDNLCKNNKELFVMTKKSSENNAAAFEEFKNLLEEYNSVDAVDYNFSVSQTDNNVMRKTLSERLLKFRSNLGFTKQDLSNALGLSYGIINNVEHERTFFTFANLIDANTNFNNFITTQSKFKNVKKDAFVLSMIGIISPYDIYETEHKLDDCDVFYKIYSKLSPTDKKKIVERMEYIVNSYTNEIPTKQVALLGQTACGNPIEAIMNSEEYVETNDLRASFALKAVGDSMLPLINDGDIMLIKHTEILEVGDIGIFQINKTGFSIDEQVTCKILKSNKNGIMTLVPLNNSFDPIVINTKEEQIKIIGKYLGKA